MSKNKNITIRSISDNDILKITKGRKVTNPEDFNLRKGSKKSDSYLTPVVGGLYDSRLFGSIYEDRCNCGKTRIIGVPCDECSSTLLDKVDRETRYAYIDLGTYYSSSVKIGLLVKFLRDNFSFKVNITTPELKFERVNDNSWKCWIHFCQFNVEGSKIVITDELTDIKKVSFDGILAAVKELKPSLLEDVMSFMNRYVIVYPSILRKVKYYVLDGKKKLKLPKSTAYYRSIIVAADICSKIVKESNDLYEIASYRANLAQYCTRVLDQMSGLLKSSKKTYVRSEYKINVRKSGRAVISGDPTLPIDTIKIPRVLAYEMYKKNFIQYLQDEFGYSENAAIKIYNHPDDDVNAKFDEFCKGEIVIINRPPTLHTENIQAYKVALSEDYGIHFPLLTTAAQNADFDGDAVTFYAVPPELKEMVYDHASPSRYTNYVNNDEPILKVRHEILYGLTIASKCIEGSEIPEFNSYEDALEDFNSDGIWINDMIKIGDKVTSLGREQIARFMGVDSLDEIIADEPVTAGNVAKLYKVINAMDPDTKVECLKNLQDLSLETVTLEGATSLDLSELYYDVPQSYREEIKELIDSDMPEFDKILRAESIHTNMVNEMLSDDKGIGSDVVTRIKEGNRGKMSAIIDMLVPSFNIDPSGSVHFNEHSLVEGLTEDEYLSHSSANRESLATKASMVPFSGYFNRQIKDPASKIIMMKDEEDTDDAGLTIPMKMAVGRTSIDGKIIGENNSDAIVAVRSILTTRMPFATKDMFSDKYDFTYEPDGRCHVGTRFILAYGADLTQSGLSLKHGGCSRYISDENKLIAPYDTEVTFEEATLTFVATGDQFIRPTKFTSRGPGFYKKGEVVGFVPKLHTFTYNVEGIVSMIGAVGNIGNKDMSNKFVTNRCFNGATASKLILENNGFTVRIGNLKITRDERLFHYPIGTMIEPYQRFSSGLQSLRSLNKESMIDRFRIFVNQMNELHNANLEIFEIIFLIITNGGEKFKGLLHSNTTGNENAVKALGYGHSGKAASRIMKGELKMNPNDGAISEFLIQPILYQLIANINSDEEVRIH